MSNIFGYTGIQYGFVSVDTYGSLQTRNLIWNTSTLAWEKATGSAGAGNVTVTNFPATQAISAVSLPLPSGAATSANQATIIANLQALNSLAPSIHDYINFSYDGANNLTGVVYKSGGAGGAIVSTLGLTYDGSNNLLTVTRT